MPAFQGSGERLRLPISVGNSIHLHHNDHDHDTLFVVLVACLACLTEILLPMLWVIVAQRRDGGRCKPTNAGFIFNRQGRYRPYDFPAVSARVSWSTARRKLSLYL